jgi:hypothetical protein
MEELFKIVVTGTSEPVSGCESLTAEQVQAWLRDNQEAFAEPNEFSDTVKYITIPLAAE